MPELIRDISGPVGRLEARLEDPASNCRPGPPPDTSAGGSVPARAAVVLAHPHPLHGGTMHTKAVFHLAKGFCRIGCPVLRFNFRGVGTSEGQFDDGPGEMADFRAAVDFMNARYPGTPVWAAGFSFGSWIASTVATSDARVTVWVGVATPVDRYDFTPLLHSEQPKFFIHGERDELCSLKAVRDFYARAPEPKELVVIDMADHLFDGHVSELADTVEDLLGDWRS